MGEEEREWGGRGENRGQHHHQHHHHGKIGPVEEIWLEFDGYRETSLKMLPIQHELGQTAEQEIFQAEKDLHCQKWASLSSQEVVGRERSSSSLAREEEEMEGRSGFFQLLQLQKEKQDEEELSPAFVEYLGRNKQQGKNSSGGVQGYLRNSSQAGHGHLRNSSEENGQQDSLTPAFHHYLGSVIHRHSNSTTGSEDSRPSLSPEMVWLSPSSPSSSSVLTLEDEEDEEEDNISFIFIEQSRITHRYIASRGQREREQEIYEVLPPGPMSFTVC